MQTETVIRIEGMSCGHCEATVALAIERLPGVKKVRVKRRKSVACVRYDDAVTTEDEIREAIRATGYELVSDDDRRSHNHEA